MVVAWWWHGGGMVVAWWWHGGGMVVAWWWHGGGMVVAWWHVGNTPYPSSFLRGCRRLTGTFRHFSF